MRVWIAVVERFSYESDQWIIEDLIVFSSERLCRDYISARQKDEDISIDFFERTIYAEHTEPSNI